MDQARIGMLLKTLRRAKGVTQEALAETLRVSNRTVSRWENGHNLPDFDLLIEMANYFSVSIDELLNGERTANAMEQKTGDTLHKIAEYNNAERTRLMKRLHGLLVAVLVGLACYLLIDLAGLEDTAPYGSVAEFALGGAFGMTIVSAVFTSRYGARIQAAKQRLPHRAQ